MVVSEEHQQRGNLLILIAFLLLISGCYQPLEKLAIKEYNPVEYVFRVKENELKNIIVNEFEESGEMDLYFADKKPLDSLTIFHQYGNADDFYLTYSDYFRYKGGRKSYLYPNNEFVAGFHLHLSQVGNDSTRISVFTINPRILVGKEFLPSPPHFVRKNKYVNVSVSTIEEYEILYKIGKKLGQSMPEIKFAQ